MNSAPAKPSLEEELAWAGYFRKYEPAVSAFFDYIEQADGEKLNLNQVAWILNPVLSRLITVESIRLGPNFTGKPS